MYKAKDWVGAFKNSATGIEIAMVLLSEGFGLREILDAFYNACYVVGLEGPDQSRFHVSDKPLSDLAVIITGVDPTHFPGFILPRRLWYTK